MWFVWVVMFCVCVTGFSPSSIHPHPHESMCTVCVYLQCVGCMMMQSAQQQVKRREKRKEERGGERRGEQPINKNKRTKERESKVREASTKKQKTETRKTAVRLLRVSQCRRPSIGGAALPLSATFIPTGSRPLSSRLDRGS